MKKQYFFLLVLTWGMSAFLTFCSAGNLDVTFNPTGAGGTQPGTLTSSIGMFDDRSFTVVVQPDGKIIVGSFGFAIGNQFQLVRYYEDGTLDATFGSGGVVTTAIGDFAAVLAIALQPDGKIIAAGASDNAGTIQFTLARYLADGSLDGSFGSGGIVTTLIVGDDDAALSVLVQDDGKIIAVGKSLDLLGHYRFALVRYLADGSLDGSFGSGGIVVTAIGGIDDQAVRSALQPDGKIIASGFAQIAGNYQFALARYLSDGSLDATFGNAGIVTTSIGGVDDEIFGVALQPNGKIIASGFGQIAGAYQFVTARYTSNGLLDPSFGAGGIVTTAIGGINDQAYGVVRQPDGKIVVAGFAQINGSKQFAVVRYTEQGSLDATFNALGHGGVEPGMVVTSLGGVDDEAFTVILQKDGKIILDGTSLINGTYRFALARYIGQSMQESILVQAIKNKYCR